MDSKPDSLKIYFNSDEGLNELIPATSLGGDRYKLDATPWYQYGISKNDIVAALPDANGITVFSHLIEKSGHKTIRFILEGEDTELFEKISSLGCQYHNAYQSVIAVDVPAGIDLDDLLDMLETHEVYYEYGDPEQDSEEGH